MFNNNSRSVIRCLAEALYLFKTNKQVGIKTIQKYTRVKEPEILEDSYNQFREYLDAVPYVSREGVATLLASVGEKEPKARQMRLEDLMDMRFVAELEREGFFKKLWGR